MVAGGVIRTHRYWQPPLFWKQGLESESDDATGPDIDMLTLVAVAAAESAA